MLLLFSLKQQRGRHQAGEPPVLLAAKHNSRG